MVKTSCYTCGLCVPAVILPAPLLAQRTVHIRLVIVWILSLLIIRILPLPSVAHVACMAANALEETPAAAKALAANSYGLLVVLVAAAIAAVLTNDHTGWVPAAVAGGSFNARRSALTTFFDILGVTYAAAGSRIVAAIFIPATAFWLRGLLLQHAQRAAHT
jgi:hypothetical protein